MDWIETIKQYLNVHELSRLFAQYHDLGPLIAIGLPFLEALIPALPLVVFVVANVNSFDPVLGFVYSLIGSFGGAMIVFFAARHLGQQRFFHFLSKHPQVNKMVGWVEKHGFGPIFLLLCFPFTPSSIVNVVAGLSNIAAWQYALAAFLGRVIVIGMMTFVGRDLSDFIEHPSRAVVAIAVIGALWLIGKQVENRLLKRIESKS